MKSRSLQAQERHGVMRRKKPNCVDRPRSFHIEELFFSTTDSQGVIQSGNDVFTRVSGYDESELIGKPHSKIRHPDMPACVFRIFWNRLIAGQSIAAYVKNRAKERRVLLGHGHRDTGRRRIPVGPAEAFE